MKNRIVVALLMPLLLVACFTVKFITGYDEVLDQTVNRMKTDFNVHFIKLARTIQDSDPNNQKFENFLDYYDHLQADLITIKARTSVLDGKAKIVKDQVEKLDSSFQVFITMHKRGIPDRQGDDHHTDQNAINSSFDAIIILQESLKTTGKPN